MPTIKTSGGKVVTKAGVPSCSCCTPCSPDSIYCIVITGVGEYSVVDIDGTGQTFASAFDSLGNPDYTAPYLTWNGTTLRWQVSDGTLITSNSSGGSTDPCDPVDSSYTSADGPPASLEAEVTAGGCTCSPDYTEYCIDIDGVSYTVTGSLSSGYFENVGNGVLEWDSVNNEWYIYDDATGEYSDSLSGSRNRCDPTVGYYSAASWTTVTVTQGAC